MRSDLKPEKIHTTKPLNIYCDLLSLHHADNPHHPFTRHLYLSRSPLGGVTSGLFVVGCFRQVQTISVFVNVNV